MKNNNALLLMIAMMNMCSFQLLAQKTNPTVDPIKSMLSSYEKYIDANNDTHVKEFIELVSIPSISSIPAHKADVVKAAEWIVNKLKAIGVTKAEVMATG